MTRVATPANEQRLLDMARGATGAQLRPDEAELVMQMLKEVRERLRDEQKASPDVTAVTSESELADALLIAAETVRASPPATRRGVGRELVIQLREDRLAGGPWLAELGNGSSVDGATLRRLVPPARKFGRDF